MQREIKLRAWIPKLKVILDEVYPTSSKMIGMDYDVFESIIEENDIIINSDRVYDKADNHLMDLLLGEDWLWFDDGDFELMQFTGLLDKNGKEIWEGDLFQVAKNMIYRVEYRAESENNFERAYACFCLCDPERAVIPFDEWAMKNGEVIGNIFENENLL